MSTEEITECSICLKTINIQRLASATEQGTKIANSMPIRRPIMIRISESTVAQATKSNEARKAATFEFIRIGPALALQLHLLLRRILLVRT